MKQERAPDRFRTRQSDSLDHDSSNVSLNEYNCAISSHLNFISQSLYQSSSVPRDAPTIVLCLCFSSPERSTTKPMSNFPSNIITAPGNFGFHFVVEQRFILGFNYMDSFSACVVLRWALLSVNHFARLKFNWRN